MSINRSQVARYPRSGNGLAATADLAAGDVIIRVDNPYLAIVENAALDRVCSHCLYEKTPLKRCTGCKTVQYCSSKCQTISWKASHKAECAIYKKLPAIPPTPVRGLMDLLIREELSAVSNPRWVGLEGHAASLQKQKRWDEITLQAKAAVEFTGSPANYMEAAINVLCRMTTNAFRLTLADNTPIGLCFEPVLSLANHSCTPNATIMFDGRRIELRALDRIAKDGQIFISYIDPTQARSVRQEELQSRYFFMCECGKCVGDDGAYETFLKTEIVPWSQMDLFIEPQALRDFAASQCERKSSTALTPTSTPAHTPTPVALQALYLAHLDNAQYLPALLLLLHIHIRHGVYLYPQPHHPVRVVQLFTLARLLTTVSSLQAPQAPQTSPSPSSPNPSFNYDRIMLGIDPPLRGDASRVLGELDIVSAVQILLSFVRELAGRSHGVESAFVREVEAELRDVERVQRERGVVGERLRGWAVDGDVEGREFARRVLGGLRALEKLGESVGRAAVR